MGAGFYDKFLYLHYLPDTKNVVIFTILKEKYVKRFVMHCHEKAADFSADLYNEIIVVFPQEVTCLNGKDVFLCSLSLS